MQLDAVLWLLLISDLGHDDFYRREAATGALATRGPLVLSLLDRAVSDSDVEIGSRASRLRRDQLVRLADLIRPSDGGELPWLDQIDRVSPEEIWYYLWEGRQTLPPAVQQGGPLWPEYRTATRAWIRDRLAERIEPAEIVRRLDAGQARERAWHAAQRIPAPAGQ